MNILELIEKKKHNGVFTEEEIKFFIEGVTKGVFADYQISALLMSIYFAGLNLDETVSMTKYMAQSGQVLDLSDISNNIIDKHSTGGVGDKITLIFISLIAAAGLYTAKLSGRGLGHTGGTVDKLASIPGFKTDLSIKEFKEQVKREGAAIAAQTSELAPADAKLYALRDVTGTVDIIPLIASSVVSKKIASGADNIVLDVKYGRGAFIKTAQEAEKLSEIMVYTGKKLNRNISAVITDMNVPLGRAIGNSLEVQETIEFLKGKIEQDLKEITYALCLKAFEKAGKKADIQYLDELITSGAALKKFKEIIQAQGGDAGVIGDYTKFPQASIKYEVKAPESGYIYDIDALKTAKACKMLGAGREKKTDKIDYSAGIYLVKKISETVKQGETIAVIHTNKRDDVKEAESLMLDAYTISDKKPQSRRLVYKVIN